MAEEVLLGSFVSPVSPWLESPPLYCQIASFRAISCGCWVLLGWWRLLPQSQSNRGTQDSERAARASGQTSAAEVDGWVFLEK